MPVFKYLGLTKEDQAARIERGVKAAMPAEVPNQPPMYRLDSRDSPMVVDEKKKRLAAWKETRRAELEADVAAIDAQCVNGGFVFPKGEPVEVPDHPENEYLIRKLELRCTARGGGAFAKVEKTNDKPAPKAKKAEIKVEEK